MSNFEYFKDDEIKGLMVDLVHKLDRAREYFGSPIIITSGFRDSFQNAAAGGVKDSAHESGMAVDIKCADTELQKKLVWALACAGFKRCGVYNRHIHVDIDSSKPTPAYWTGTSH